MAIQRNPDGTIASGILNPKGRGKGVKSKLQNDFIADVYNEWQENGAIALKAMIAEKPGDFCRMVASLMPKEIEFKEKTQTEEFLQNATDEQLAALVTIAVDYAASRISEKGAAGEAGEKKPTGIH